MSKEERDITLFHYEESIYSHRTLWFLNLHGIKYNECIQPGWLPRPDISDGLHINYRRIPILAIGRDIYCDTRAILIALEEYAQKPLRLDVPADRGLRKLFESHCMNGGIFSHAVTLLPLSHHPFLKDPQFLDDRSKLLGRPFNDDVLAPSRPAALAHMRMAFDLMETTFLADGREWVLGTNHGASLADIDAIYPLQWIVRDPLMHGGGSEKYINAEIFPKTFAWIDRFLALVASSKTENSDPVRLNGFEAVIKILEATQTTAEFHVDGGDPLQLQPGDTVKVSTKEGAQTHYDVGKLLGLNVQSVCILNDKNLRLHFPRWNFDIQKIDSSLGELLKSPSVHPEPMLSL